MLEVVIYIRPHASGEISNQKEQVVKELERNFEKQYPSNLRNLKILNTVIFSFHIQFLHLNSGKILQRLEVYKNYQHLYDLRIAILLNLSPLYLSNQDKNMCKQICYTLLEDAKNKKSYDRLAICYVRIGICTDDSKLIQKGFSLLELTEETFMLSHLKKEVEIYFQAKER
ncbi:hypothetical protein CGSSp3BS71_08401 [Streptococcus pneumoniae SP3-BS71]|nr:hypothetical protein CGSSp3BS71_08401 [Streptococcus pneumoniae SP3-BS71]